MENLIPIVNQLQEVVSLAKVKLPINLPRIIVVGSQSSGKSSVLESIVGKDFLPRGTGIVTRCPLILRLIKSDIDQDYATFSHVPDCLFTDFSDVTREITTINKEIAQTEGVSTKEILMNIYSSRVVDLTLIDLPGIIKVPLKGQAKDLDRRINHMIMEYASQPNSIILAISPANSDLANSDALNIARQVDPEGKRTIGVITKIDIMDKGTNALEMLQGHLYKLSLGYVGVICRCQEDINNSVSLIDHLQKEKHYFENHPIYKSHAHKLGFEYLSNRLSSIFKHHIAETIPSIKREIEQLYETTTKDLKDLGTSLDSQKDRNELIYSVISNFCKKFEDNIDGKDLDNNFKEFTGGSMILFLFKNFYEEVIMPIDPIKDLGDYQIRIAILNATGAKGVLFVSETAFENLLVDIIKKLETHCLECLYQVRDELYKIITGISIKEFNRFANLHENLIKIAYKVVDDCIPLAEQNILSILHCESSFLNISHPDFMQADEASLLAKQHLEESAKKPKIEKLKMIQKKETGYLGFFNWGKSDENEEIESIAPVEKLDNILEEEMGSKELEQVVLIKLLIQSYFDIAKKNIADSVPKAIMRKLIVQSKEKLQMILTNELHGNAEIHEVLFEENTEVANKRENLKGLKESLEKALAALKGVSV